MIVFITLIIVLYLWYRMSKLEKALLPEEEDRHFYTYEDVLEWKCENCGSDDGPHFDRSLCACGMMHYYCGQCGEQDDPCDEEIA